MKRTLAAGAALLLVLGVTGCGGEDPEPKFTQSHTKTSSAATPTTPPAEEPVALTPEETVKAWVEARNDLMASGDDSIVQSLSDGSCTSCSNLNDPVRQAYDLGGYVRTRGWQVASVAKRPAFRTSHEVVAAIDFAAGVKVSKVGAEPTRFSRDKNILQFKLVRARGLDQWRVAEIVFLS